MLSITNSPLRLDLRVKLPSFYFQVIKENGRDRERYNAGRGRKTEEVGLHRAKGISYSTLSHWSSQGPRQGFWVEQVENNPHRLTRHIS